MAKVLDSISLDSPAAPVSAVPTDTFSFAGTPSFSGSGGVQRYDWKWEVDDGGGYVTIGASGTGLITADENPITNSNSQTQNAITVTCDQAGSYTIRMAGAPSTGGSYTVFSATQTVEVSAAVTHVTSGALTGPGAAVAGTAARFRAHATSGALTGPGAAVAGSASRVAAPVTHATSGALTGPGASVVGAAARFRAHATSGAISGPGASVAGSASRSSGPVTHATSGALTGPGATVIGAAARFRAHATSGVLAGPGAAVAGSAARVDGEGGPVTHATSGALVGSGATVIGAAARFRAHATSGALTGPGASVSGVADSGGAEALPDNPTTHPILLPVGVEDDREFERFARVAEIEADLEDIERFIEEVEASGDEFVDVFDHDPFTDRRLFGRRMARGR